ncbi:MAG: hypothetical protein KDC76_13050 [Bacteroidetes bacterium]|nr:hypothetical protein [Bacteroidota bacterium]
MNSLKYARLLLLMPLLAFVYGDYRPETARIHYFEQSHNLEYFGLNDTVILMNDKGKEYSEMKTVNIGIYDIAADSTYTLFNGQNVWIEEFIFESAFMDSLHYVSFNNNEQTCSGRYREHYEFLNNCSLTKRAISDNLLILTRDAQGMKHFWRCTKQGGNLKKMISFPKTWIWEIDVKNRSVSAYSTQNGELQLRNFKY